MRGSLLGLAAGDALGAVIERLAPGTFEPVTDMVGGGRLGRGAGEWTDDTSMALCLAESLVESAGFDPVDQMRRYVRWIREGHLSATGRSAAAGRTTIAAIARFEKTGKLGPSVRETKEAGNGSLMRLAPVPLFYATDPRVAMDRAAESSLVTHHAPAAVDACRYFAGLIVGALAGAPKQELLAQRYSPVPEYFDKLPMHDEVDEVACGSFLRREPPLIESSGYVVRTLEAALWAFERSVSFADGCLLAVNLGGDADTTGAIYGQLAGAHYGVHAIPGAWRMQLARRGTIEELADRLYEKGIVQATG